MTLVHARPTDVTTRPGPKPITHRWMSAPGAEQPAVGVHSLRPAGVSMPRSARAAAMPRSVMTPPSRISRITGAKSVARACARATPDRRAGRRAVSGARPPRSPPSFDAASLGRSQGRLGARRDHLALGLRDDGHHLDDHLVGLWDAAPLGGCKARTSPAPWSSRRAGGTLRNESGAGGDCNARPPPPPARRPSRGRRRRFWPRARRRRGELPAPADAGAAEEDIDEVLGMLALR